MIRKYKLSSIVIIYEAYMKNDLIYHRSRGDDSFEYRKTLLMNAHQASNFIFSIFYFFG